MKTILEEVVKVCKIEYLYIEKDDKKIKREQDRKQEQEQIKKDTFRFKLIQYITLFLYYYKDVFFPFLPIYCPGTKNNQNLMAANTISFVKYKNNKVFDSVKKTIDIFLHTKDNDDDDMMTTNIEDFIIKIYIYLLTIYILVMIKPQIRMVR